MCGIAGYLNFDGNPSDESILLSMGKSLTHRGPDDFGIYRKGPIGLVHTRLSIIDLTGGHQPMVDSDDMLSLVTNGEIYNYVELRDDLKRKGRVFRTLSDSETILHAYAEYGEEFLSHLNGMFAFALYDSKTNRLILARDRLGIKPLYYVWLSNRIAFASEIKTLLKILPKQPEIDGEAFYDLLQNQSVSGENTLFEQIKRVMPGEAIIVDNGSKIRKMTYWSILGSRSSSYTYEEAKKEFDDLINIVMREHVRSDVPYGLFLSGGVDSSVLLSQLVHYQDRPIRTFSLGYESTQKRNELDDAERIARRFGTNHTSIMVKKEKLFLRIPHMIWSTDDLMQDYATLPTSILAEEASKELKVVFTGEGGDEVFAGYNSYRKPAYMIKLRKLWSPKYRGIRVKGQWLKGASARALGPKLSQLKKSFSDPTLQSLQSMPVKWSFIQTSQAKDIVGNMRNRLLVKVDRMLMAFGLEGRVPYLDHRVVEFGFSLPDYLKVQARFKGKFFLKQYGQGSIPSDHLLLKKRGFHAPADQLLSGKFLNRLEKKLLDNVAIQSWFSNDGVKGLFRRQRVRRNSTDEIWSLMQFAIWHHLFIEHGNRKPTVEEDPLDWIS